MWKMTGKHLLCICLLAIQLSWAEDTKEDASKDDNDSVWNQGKQRRLFARRRISPPQGSQIPKLKPDAVTPARRCGRLMENCSSHVPCCDPCASCRCRLFNTICHCWRMGPKCSKRP
ncbi:agouti-signaling protein 2b [Centroberyx gerrardi]|uniref:agouti-signaling protein 2b n=1 Tax=Centroberyx gerrardi TaxID=166262 RepID=UPI003AAB8795